MEGECTIPPQLFEAYLKCRTKCFLRSLGETALENPYANWTCTRNALYAREEMIWLREGLATNQCVTGQINKAGLTSGTWQLATESTMHTDKLECTFHAVE